MEAFNTSINNFRSCKWS